MLAFAVLEFPSIKGLLTVGGHQEAITSNMLVCVCVCDVSAAGGWRWAC
jgi:hypothetical protein